MFTYVNSVACGAKNVPKKNFFLGGEGVIRGAESNGVKIFFVNFNP